MLCPLPAPAGMVWRYPGVPAILVTYGTANDLFFSGHTAIAVYAAATLAGDWGAWGLAIGLVIALFEAITVLVLRVAGTGFRPAIRSLRARHGARRARAPRRGSPATAEPSAPHPRDAPSRR